ncbi:MAG: hypothetical protein Ct9H90mP7_2070 [Candidatus Neomarinimicrobiota bacterium]|nr:MAG: hypothetical protein Ct9H90mP7_2070 [Candidatus Neomarinimicrobiota bacterium]
MNGVEVTPLLTAISVTSLKNRKLMVAKERSPSSAVA